ncbi:hypothetical protein [Paenibacillus alvei]|uniref:hypothetical protein n=1 Tax=Paenibacillus alvei TaxID=44250 RepID=UPI0013DD07A8|nr:hypothetical protein [Paenibacillus alvei]NEZ42810.1 hypothetical protein [Paenibacillus alvei]
MTSNKRKIGKTRKGIAIISQRRPPLCLGSLTAINGAIKDLRAAKRFLSLGRFERAETALANSLPDITKAIRNINRIERH